MNGYVAGGWGATAGILALYTWRVIYRGRVLSRALPPEASPARAGTGETRSTGADPSGAPGTSEATEVRAWP